MTKILILALAVVFCSCSRDGREESAIPKDDDSKSVVPKNGLYMTDANGLNQFYCAKLKNGNCTYFAVIGGDGEVHEPWNNEFATSGKYPSYDYQVGDLAIHAEFTDTITFSADLSGVIKTEQPNGGLAGGLTIYIDSKGIIFKLSEDVEDDDNQEDHEPNGQKA